MNCRVTPIEKCGLKAPASPHGQATGSLSSAKSIMCTGRGSRSITLDFPQCPIRHGHILGSGVSRLLCLPAPSP
jgi:hypothetical protein